jgi:hypothetical protein
MDEGKLVEWLRTPVTGDIKEIHGVGPVAVKTFADCEDKIETTFQLFGKFLSLKGVGVDAVEHTDRFFYWLKHIGINANRATIVKAVAEKLNLQFPGIYDENAYD